MTEIRLTLECHRRFQSDFKKGLFQEDDSLVLKAWASEMERYGPRYIQNSANWRDHALDKVWLGYRASCFSQTGRIIYRILDKQTVEICEIERITPNHDYKR